MLWGGGAGRGGEEKWVRERTVVKLTAARCGVWDGRDERSAGVRCSLLLVVPAATFSHISPHFRPTFSPTLPQVLQYMLYIVSAVASEARSLSALCPALSIPPDACPDFATLSVDSSSLTDLVNQLLASGAATGGMSPEADQSEAQRQYAACIRARRPLQRLSLQQVRAGGTRGQGSFLMHPLHIRHQPFWSLSVAGGGRPPSSQSPLTLPAPPVASPNTLDLISPNPHPAPLPSASWCAVCSSLVRS